MRTHDRRRGSALLEFALTGVPFLFLWISIVQLSIGMWQYHTLQYAVKTAGSYAAVHGSDCSTGGNSCTVEVKDVAKVLQNFAIGLDPTAIQVTFTAFASDHITAVSTISCQLSGGGSPCSGNTSQWPPPPYNTPGTDIQIQTEYLFRSALAMVAPGPGTTPVKFGTIWLPGDTHQTIVF